MFVYESFSNKTQGNDTVTVVTVYSYQEKMGAITTSLFIIKII